MVRFWGGESLLHILWVVPRVLWVLELGVGGLVGDIGNSESVRVRHDTLYWITEHGFRRSVERMHDIYLLREVSRTFRIRSTLFLLSFPPGLQRPFLHRMRTEYVQLGRLVPIILQSYKQRSVLPPCMIKVLREGREMTWRTCPSLQVITPVEGSLRNCFDPHTSQRLREGAMNSSFQLRSSFRVGSMNL